MQETLARWQFAFTELIACIAVISAVIEVFGDRQGWAFVATTITIAACIVTLFVDLYPNVMISSTNPAYSLTANNAASTPYTRSRRPGSGHPGRIAPRQAQALARRPRLTDAARAG